MEELKPCPYCGCETAAMHGGADNSTMMYWVSCLSCGARGGRAFSKDDAAKKWNRRAAPENKICTDCSGIMYRQTGSGKIIPVDQRCGVKITPPCYQPDGDGCAYQIYGDNNDEPIDRCKACPLCYSDKVRHTAPENPRRKSGTESAKNGSVPAPDGGGNKPRTCEGCVNLSGGLGYLACDGCCRKFPDRYETHRPESVP